MERHGTTRGPRWLFVLAGLLTWTSADGDRQCERPKRQPPRPVARCVAPPARRPAPAVEYYYPAERPPAR